MLSPAAAVCLICIPRVLPPSLVFPSNQPLRIACTCVPPAPPPAQEQNIILARILWDPVQGTVLAMCSTSLHLLFGTDRDRISQLKKAVEAAASWNCLPAHGLVDWRRLHPPPNTTPPAIVRLIEQHFDLYTYSNPMDASRRATDPQQRSMTALGDGASKAVGGAVCATTARRYMERLLQRENSKFLPCGIDHNGTCT